MRYIVFLILTVLGISQMIATPHFDLLSKNAQTVSLSILDHRNEVNPKVLPNFYALKVNK